MDVSQERRLLILAPVGRDYALIASLLARAGLACLPCRDVEQLARELTAGAGALLITEEAYAQGEALLAEAVSRQPSWSDIPILLLTRPGADSATAERAIESLGNVTLLERPVRPHALSSAVRSALRARERQYHMRAHLEERHEADQRKDHFLAMLAHELRNPLAPIRTSLDIIRASSPDSPAYAVTRIMERQVDQLVRLVDDLIDVSRITRGTIELRRGPVDLARVIEAAIETSRPLIETSRHELAVDLPAETLVVDADSMRLAQVFSNLLNNAARYTDPGGRIEIRAGREDESAVVSIADTGIGMPPEALPRVFDLFTRADARDRHSHSGLGIGLTVARSLVEMHDGGIHARSEGTGRGSEFVVRLPLSREKKPSAEPILAPLAAMNTSERVLVVDDNRDAADSLGALLEMLGADVRVAYDGVTALCVIEGFRPGVAVLDIGMPGMDGYELARRIRQRPEGSCTTLVALTGWGQEKDRHLTRTAGFDHHLIKPVEIEALHTVLALAGKHA